MIREHLIHLAMLIVAALWPALAILRNIPLGTDPWGPLVVSLASFGAALILYVALTALARQNAARAASLCTVALLAFYSFGFFKDAFAESFGHNFYLAVKAALAAWFAASLLALALSWLFLRTRRARSVLAISLAAMLCASLVQLALTLAPHWSRDAGAGAVDVAQAGHAGTRPGVYYILPDAYGRHDQLLRHAGFDNRPFLSALEERGFRVLENSHANYIRTDFSVPHTLAMDYVIVDEETLREEQENRGPLRAIKQGFNPVYDKMRSLGYTHIHAGLGCYGREDICLNRRAVASHSVVEMLHLTPIPLALWRLSPEFAARLLLSANIWLPDVTAALSSVDRSTPVFAFVHSMHPHDALYEADCSLIPGLSEQVVAAHGNDDRTTKKVSAYVSTIECLNGQLLELVDAIVERDPDALVVIAADHGPAFSVDWDAPVTRWSMEQVAERSSILTALRLPDRCGREVYDGMSPVNHFRLVFACLENRAPEFLEERTYLTRYEGLDLRMVSAAEFAALPAGRQ